MEANNFIVEVRPDPPAPSCSLCGALMTAKAYKCLSCGMEIGAANHELAELRAWKESALANTPDLQAIGKILEVPLGESISDKVVPRIAELKLAETLLKELIDADGHAMDCQFTGCTCGRARRYAEVRSRALSYLKRRNT